MTERAETGQSDMQEAKTWMSSAAWGNSSTYFLWMSLYSLNARDTSLIQRLKGEYIQKHYYTSSQLIAERAVSTAGIWYSYKYSKL